MTNRPIEAASGPLYNYTYIHIILQCPRNDPAHLFEHAPALFEFPFYAISLPLNSC